MTRPGTSAEAAVGVPRRGRPVDGDNGDDDSDSDSDEREAPRLRPVGERVRTAGGAGRALSPGVAGEVAGTARTRRGIAGALAVAPAAHGGHGDIPL
ncbi:hypothetical protein [Streptosporangium vulgare]|uniref:Uncharacterized protein n=1 Tax=Streptosporangium vulgare TaxID=46190 RepID=A0ABV5T878_9ACTN